MNIALDLRSWRAETGGVGRYQRNLLLELLKIDRHNHYTAIITPKDEPEFHVTAPNLNKLVVDAKTYSPAGQRLLLKVLNKNHFDLVHFTHFDHPIFYRRPFVVTVHDMIMHFFPPALSDKTLAQRLIFRSAYRLIFNDCKRAKKIIVPSRASKNDLVKNLRFPVKKVVVTEEGSEERFHPHSPAEKARLREKLKLPDRYLLFVSRWERYKGLPELVKAYESLREARPDLGLVITGKPDKTYPEVERIVRQAQAGNPLVITTGFVDDQDLAPLYSAATVYVHPSWYEGFGIMILEAFSAGVPVVTTNVSSLPEVVGGAGLLTEPKNWRDLAEKIGQVLDDPVLAEELIKKGYAQAKKFSWAKMAQETLAIYQQVTNG